LLATEHDSLAMNGRPVQYLNSPLPSPRMGHQSGVDQQNGRTVFGIFACPLPVLARSSLNGEHVQDARMMSLVDVYVAAHLGLL
jgi:hypothetical protein